MNLRQAYLLTCAAGVALLALSYGAMPVQSMKLLFGITVADVNTAHILRAVMGLYLAMALFWAMSAGFVRGVGFVPQRWAWRALFSGWSCAAALALAAMLKLQH